MKQTAVEWLFQELDNYYQMKGNVIKKEILKQAKEMEKEQIIDAYINGGNQHRFKAEAEQYYNETFNN
jgi:hypothetical protein